MRALYKYGAEILMAVAIIVLWVLGALLFRHTIPQYDFGWAYHLIPGFFLMLALVAMVLVSGWEYSVETGKIGRDSTMTRYMVWKAIKMGLCILFILAYWLISDYMFNSFLFTFLIFYIVSLTMESVLFTKLQTRIDRHIAESGGNSGKTE